MILTRMGNKRKLAHKISPLFPEHRMRIELFFGAGGSYFYMPKPQYAILNDLDDDVTNLYMQLLHNKEALQRAIELMPISQSLVNHWKRNLEHEPLKKAVRFLLLSNFTYLGKGDTLRLGLDNAKKTLLNNIEPTLEYLQHAKILSVDFRQVISKISFSKGLNDKEKAFCYLDPIYHETEYVYRVPKWKPEDTLDCLSIVATCGMRSAMSEFDHPFVTDAARELGLNVIEIGERSNIKNRRTEILITNYEVAMPEQKPLQCSLTF